MIRLKKWVSQVVEEWQSARPGQVSALPITIKERKGNSLRAFFYDSTSTDVP